MDVVNKRTTDGNTLFLYIERRSGMFIKKQAAIGRLLNLEHKY